MASKNAGAKPATSGSLEAESTDFTSMLESKNFSDATITCDERTWKIHRNIMAHRCEWFAKAFVGHFAEATTLSVDLKDHDSQMVDWMIKAIYSGSGQSPYSWQEIAQRITNWFQALFIKKDIVSDEETLHENVVKVFMAGDFFQLPILRMAAIEALMEHNRFRAADFQRDYDKARQDTILLPEGFKFFGDIYQDKFFAQAKIVFDNDLESWEPLRMAFFHLIVCTRYFVLDDVAFHERLRSVPNLALLILKKMTLGSITSGRTFPEYYETCHVKVLHEDGGEGRFFSVLRRGGGQYSKSGFVGQCNSCVKI